MIGATAAGGPHPPRVAEPSQRLGYTFSHAFSYASRAAGHSRTKGAGMASRQLDHLGGSACRTGPSPVLALKSSRDVAQLGSAFDWGSKGRGFESRRPDKRDSPVAGPFPMWENLLHLHREGPAPHIHEASRHWRSSLIGEEHAHRSAPPVLRIARSHQIEGLSSFTSLKTCLETATRALGQFEKTSVGGQPSSCSMVATDGFSVRRSPRATISASRSTRTAFPQVSLARSASDQSRPSSSAIRLG
ncbi:MAG: hypothetical protein JWR24_5582 [Actinoallomurus sp.]|nr:hypothetical protein [Actinoallomurus sp.]